MTKMNDRSSQNRGFDCLSHKRLRESDIGISPHDPYLALDQKLNRERSLLCLELVVRSSKATFRSSPLKLFEVIKRSVL